MQMKLTEEQSRMGASIVHDRGNYFLAMQDLADYLQPLFAREMLGPVTDDEKREQGLSPTYAPLTTLSILERRLRRYAPEPQDPAVEAVKRLNEKNGWCCVAEEVVAAVDKAREK
jgi:hypothetical protein